MTTHWQPFNPLEHLKQNLLKMKDDIRVIVQTIPDIHYISGGVDTFRSTEKRFHKVLIWRTRLPPSVPVKATILDGGYEDVFCLPMNPQSRDDFNDLLNWLKMTLREEQIEFSHIDGDWGLWMGFQAMDEDLKHENDLLMEKISKNTKMIQRIKTEITEVKEKCR